MNAQERSLDNVNPRSRRRVFLKTKLAAGFAMAVRPICAQTQIKTDAAGLTAGEVKIPTGGIEIPAYRAMPAAGSNFPVVLVVQEIFGVHEHIKDICRRLAKLGFLAIAPEMYARQGDVSKLTDFQEILKIVGKVPDSQVMADLDATLAYAATTGKADMAKFSVTGFCWGGRVVWLYAAHNPRLKAGVAWYGRLIGAPGEMTPKHPLDIAKDLKAPVLGLYGAKDRGISIDSVEKMREALKAAGNSKSRIDVYQEADHGFHADYRPTYHDPSAKDGWQKLQAWFKQNGAA
ncbi:MAG: dienelactone hydrolase family protein [Acidobacteria bacterium]|nr:dienelactone hydrolase family protein [Acidobacteriota bacterium]